MTDHTSTTKADLLAATEREWTALQATLDRLSTDQLTTIRDDHGWTVKDHLIHLAAWERSVSFLLQGQPRHAGIGVSEALYRAGDEDAINAAVYEQHKTMPLADARQQLADVHIELLALLAPLSDADLQARHRRYLPDEPGDGDGPPVIDVIYGNTADHFREHRGWIETLVAEQHP